MALAVTCVICFTWLVSLAALLVYGFPTIKKVTKHTECSEYDSDYGVVHVPGFGSSDAAQSSSDAEQEEMRKTAAEFDIAAAVNAFIEGDSK